MIGLKDISMIELAYTEMILYGILNAISKICAGVFEIAL